MKKLSLIGVLLAVLLFAGCGEKTQELKDTKNGISSKVEEGKSLVGGLKNAMKNGVAMKCETVEEESKWVVYTNGKNMRSTGMFDEKKQNILRRGGITYSWEEGSTEGQMLDMKCMQDFQKEMGISGVEDSFGEEPGDFSFDDLEESEKTGKTKCSPSTEGDFSVPKGIKFIDQCKIIKEQMSGVKDQLKQLQNQQK